MKIKINVKKSERTKTSNLKIKTGSDRAGIREK